MKHGSNSLPALASLARQHVESANHHAQKSAESFLALGKTLTEAKELCAHGNWGDWLKSANVSERMGQRAMRLHRLGLKSDTVSDLGGIKATISHFRDAQLPRSGEELFITLEDEDTPFVAIWNDGDGHRVVYVDLYSDQAEMKYFTRPIILEWGVWICVWHLFSNQFDKMLFAKSSDAWASGFMGELIAEIPN